VLHSDTSEEKARRKWSQKDLKILKEYFKDCKRPPTFPSILKLQQTYPCFRKRTLAQIKTRAWALIKKK